MERDTSALGGFENFLIENGYEVLMYKKGWVPATGRLYYSTMGHINFVFKKGETEITYGIQYHDHGPTLIHPVPMKTIEETKDENGVKTYTVYGATIADRTRLFEKYSYKEILNAIENKLCLDM